MTTSDGSEEDNHEMILRDTEYAEASDYSPCSRSELSDFIELPPFLRALDIQRDNLVMEIGCGDGRFTLLMLQRGARIIAIDISANALNKLNERLATGRAPTPFPQDAALMRDFRSRVALIHSDASKVRIAPAVLDRALSTTPLDDREQRTALYRTISEALKEDGWFVGSTEYDDLFRRTLGLPTGTRYEAGGIFIEHFSIDKINRETGAYFGKVQCWPIRPRVPLVHRVSPKLGIKICNLITSLPLLRHVGEILLFRASAPLHAEAEGIHRRGSAIVKRLFCFYSRSVGKEPIWRWEKVRL
jgi:SAM-dependent methyltransferase